MVTGLPVGDGPYTKAQTPYKYVSWSLHTKSCSRICQFEWNHGEKNPSEKNEEFKEWFQIEGRIRTKVLHIHKKKLCM